MFGLASVLPWIHACALLVIAFFAGLLPPRSGAAATIQGHGHGAAAIYFSSYSSLRWGSVGRSLILHAAAATATWGPSSILHPLRPLQLPPPEEHLLLVRLPGRPHPQVWSANPCPKLWSISAKNSILCVVVVGSSRHIWVVIFFNYCNRLM